MAIEFNSKLVTELRDDLIPTNGRANLYIMQNTIPSDGELTETKKVETRISGDSLIGFINVDRVTNQSGVEWSSLEDDEIAVFKTNSNTRATLSGTAEWFLYAWTSASRTPVYWVGTVTEPGLGGNLQIEDTDIVSGGLYWLDPVVFKLPSSFS